MLEPKYSPAAIEDRIHKAWEKAEAFKCGRKERLKAGAKPYAIVIPPPNVTGSLHMGHALNNTLQDILVRFERMRGKDVLWQPGTDHAGIATQMVVERQLAERQQPDRRAMGREKFLETVWKWKAESGGTIVNQLKRLGASCDWSRERFTMDEGLSEAVLKVFVDLYNKGFIYKDKRLVNWDPKFQSAISDLEVEQFEKKGSFRWARGDKDKQGNPVALNHASLGKLLDKDPSGHMYYFNYPLDGATYSPDDPATFITVATTRPETMLGDTAVAVHPTSEKSKYRHLIGKHVILPLTGRKIPVIGDEYADPEKGTGAVKITPAHDFNDFEVGKRHAEKLVAPINIFDAFARLALRHNIDFSRGIQDNSEFAETMRTLDQLDRFEARKKVIERLSRQNLLVKIEPTAHTVPHGDRSGVPVEPWLTDQWYVNAGELAKPALAAVREGKTRFVPERFANDYFRWLENIQPWCISRQLWWGHQIPAWYGPGKGIDGMPYDVASPIYFVAENQEAARRLAEKHYGLPIEFDETAAGADAKNLDQIASPTKIAIYRDPDVLDTWFSSALWPFSTLGWPKETGELARYYPTSALVTGFDIIFFWVARMMMMGCHFMEEVPFRDVYIHGLVRDEKGQKMSKSKGNVVDPLVMIDEYGADALRFSMAAMASQGSDVKFSVKRIEGYRNFATKVWNAARFAEQNECVRQKDFDPRTLEETVNRWIAGEVERTAAAVTRAIEEYKFNEAAASIYEFTWGTFCDWYLELVKPMLAGDDEQAKAETRACVAWVLDQILKLLHPFMPFITEELWAHVVVHGVRRQSLLALSEWPVHEGLADEAADAELGWVVGLVSEIRSVRSEMNVPAGAKIPLTLVGADKATRERADRHEDTIKRLARLEHIAHAKAAPKGAAVMVVGETTAAIPLAGLIDMDAERKRLAKAIAEAASDLAKMNAKLDNPNFVERAKEEAITEARQIKAEREGEIRKLEAALKRIEA